MPTPNGVIKMVKIPNEDINRLNVAKFKEAWLTYLADDNDYNWKRWDNLKKVMFAMGKESADVEALMNEAEASKAVTKGSKPSAFSSIFPYSSSLQECNCEVIAKNIMVILSKAGDTFRLLTWKEYKKSRKKDGNFTEREERFFDKVVDRCSSEENARKFSSCWREV
jgi:hypothetical protein